jgi:hypothetical protein
MTPAALPDFFNRFLQRGTEDSATFRISLEQVKRHTLGRFRPHAGQTSKSFNQLFN